MTQMIADAIRHRGAVVLRARHYEWRNGGACSVGCLAHDLGVTQPWLMHQAGLAALPTPDVLDHVA